MTKCQTISMHSWYLYATVAFWLSSCNMKTLFTNIMIASFAHAQTHTEFCTVWEHHDKKKRGKKRCFVHSSHLICFRVKNTVSGRHLDYHGKNLFLLKKIGVFIFLSKKNNLCIGVENYNSFLPLAFAFQCYLQQTKGYFKKTGINCFLKTVSLYDKYGSGFPHLSP